MNILVVIPARGGSKGIPRKNIRAMNNHPLIYYVIHTAKMSKFKPDIVVSTDDDEIITYSKKFGAMTIKRDSSLSLDETTLDPVVYDAYNLMKSKIQKKYDIVITMQPTSPILKTISLDNAIEKLIKNELDTIISACDDTHLMWGKNMEFFPLYEKRLNRQFLPKTYKETGGFLITKTDVISQTNRIGKKLELYLLDNGEEIDIDTYEDWAICEYLMKRKRIMFIVTGNKQDGLGHVNRAMLLANDILDHEIIFVVNYESEMAYDIVNSNNYKCIITDDFIETINDYNPDMIINDILDTDKKYIQTLKKSNIKIVNFEDVGDGSLYADLVFNALYKRKESDPQHYYTGEKYFCLRNEFIYTDCKMIKKEVNNILVTFGGTDENNLTKEMLEILSQDDFLNIKIDVVLGIGYDRHESLKQFDNFKHIKIWTDVKNISDFIFNADLIITASGRTVYEIASIGTPSIVLAQNERELTHPFACEENGFINLGLGIILDKELIKLKLGQLISSFELRTEMNRKMLSYDFKSNKKNVIKLIKELLEQ
ncbi:cytidylyltransferase domain-containing protein [Aliarcobacter sp. ERUVET-8]|uniref:cytidylyltransferase domain-containing protein n=1 Tax=Aliarcobacter sp. ERUVET-8 TaxID=3429684 RepID=UPI003D6B9521